MFRKPVQSVAPPETPGRHRRWVATWLVRLYPASWRARYGDELVECLAAEPISAGTIADVLRGALWQRVRLATPSTVLGLGAMVLVLVGVVVSPTAYGRTGGGVIIPTNQGLPTVSLVFIRSELFALLLVGGGCWTQLRLGRGAITGAMWTTALAGLPVAMFGLLLSLGFVSATMVMPGNPDQLVAPSSVAMMIAPVARTLESAIWGAVGGRLGQWWSRHRPGTA
jgi:hypothetical protein